MSKNQSPLATQFPHQDTGRKRKNPVYGVVLHTSGSGIVEKAIKANADVLEFTAAYYAKPDQYGCHYVIGWNGAIVQVAAEDEVIYHVGRSKEEIAAFRDGSWEKQVSPATLRCWRERWSATCKSPLDIGPEVSINNRYVGVEMIPLVKGVEWEIARWPREHGKFSIQQHEAARALVLDIAKRWGFVASRRAGRVIGHEDGNPLSRSNKQGGWDPGALRDNPQFDWAWVLR